MKKNLLRRIEIIEKEMSAAWSSRWQQQATLIYMSRICIPHFVAEIPADVQPGIAFAQALGYQTKEDYAQADPAELDRRFGQALEQLCAKFGVDLDRSSAPALSTAAEGMMHQLPTPSLNHLISDFVARPSLVLAFLADQREGRLTLHDGRFSWCLHLFAQLNARDHPPADPDHVPS
jgi:hypothetical protein